MNIAQESHLKCSWLLDFVVVWVVDEQGKGTCVEEGRWNSFFLQHWPIRLYSSITSLGKCCLPRMLSSCTTSNSTVKSNRVSNYPSFRPLLRHCCYLNSPLLCGLPNSGQLSSGLSFVILYVLWESMAAPGLGSMRDGGGALGRV